MPGVPKAPPLTDAKRRLVDGARRLFAAQGYTTTSIRDIGRVCGINSATLYSHFPSKAELFAEIVDPYLDAVQAAFTEASRSPGDGATRLERMMETTFDVQQAFREEYLSLVRDWHNIRRVPELEHLRERRQKGSEVWRRVIQDGIDDGSLRGDVRAGEVQWLVESLAATVLDDRLEGTTGAPPASRRRALLHVLLDGLRAGARPSLATPTARPPRS